MNYPLLIFQNNNGKANLKNILIVFLIKKQLNIHHKRHSFYHHY